MKLRIYDPIVLAIDLRHRRFGYAVFEGPRLLLGWGVRVYPATGAVEAEMARTRLGGLLKLFSPSAIVVTRERWDRAKTNLNLQSVEEALMQEAFAQSVPIYSIGQDDVKSSFHNLGCNTRYEMAAALTRFFPELLWKLPPKRRAWESEHSRMIIFDAVALGFSYWQHESTRIHPPA